MYCPRCEKIGVNCKLGIGIAIDAGTRELSRSIIACNPTITAENLRLIKCLKCSNCGYSDDGVVNEIKLQGYENKNTVY